MKLTIVIQFDHLDGTDYVFKDTLSQRDIRIPRALLPESVAEMCEIGDTAVGFTFDLTFEGPLA